VTTGQLIWSLRLRIFNLVVLLTTLSVGWLLRRITVAIEKIAQYRR